jgi:4-amino-4-deoxy-L-arabinose transferase-like glycosyltransferase/tetratricopeptide (TPR) repeat protein
MDIESQPVNLKKSWISEHPFVVIGFILVACLGPFVNKAIHTDDVLFVWAAEWIQKHPADFFGCQVNWWFSAIPMWVANYNPPLMSYFLAGVASLFGWHEIVLHLACLAVAFSAAVGIYSLAQMWCERPLLATLIAMVTPAFLVSSTTLMCDVMMLNFWIWALVLWDRALGKEQGRWQFIGAGVLAGLAVLTKYSAITLLPLLPILSILRTRKLGWWLMGLAVPVLMLAGYELITARMYGRGLFFAAVHYAQTSHVGFPGGWKASGIVGLAFAGGSLLPLLFFAPFLWRPKTLLAGGVVIFGILLGLFYKGSNLGLIQPWVNPELMNHRDFALQVMLLTAGGLHLLLLVVAETWRRRDINSVTLALWIISGLLFATVLNWTVTARSFLPIVPAAAILLVRRLETCRGNIMTDGRLLWPLIPAAAIALGIAATDYQLANLARTAAAQIAAKYKSASHTVWFEGHGAFQYYMEKFGGLPIDFERSFLQPGDTVVVPWIGSRVPLPTGSVGWIEDLEFSPFSWINLMGSSKSGAAGFYGANLGPVPFNIGKLPPQDFCVVKVFSRVQFNAQPANPREMQAGDVPSFPEITFLADDKEMLPWKPEIIKQDQLASQLVADGKVEEVIQYYREALNVDSNNPVVLNNLAWILATTSKPELRNGEEAVRLATKAVELTDRRLPRFIGTLAAAYAEAGQFSKAAQIAQTARVLAILANQPDEAAQIDQLSSRYAAGRAVDATQAR